jgi:anti-sigma regulatory factor (Ser/Thr protein kinase)
MGHATDADKATEAAARLMSETAHDLRSPLTAVRESMRIVHDGDLGKLTSDQQTYLAAAMDQCDCMEQMIGEMVQIERLRTGTPRVNRRSVPIAEVKDAIENTLRPWVMPRRINVLWDGANDPREKVFADPSMLRRLVVNLVTNAVRATTDGGVILVRLQSVRDHEAIRWSIVDQGSGISESDLKRIADRHVSFGGGEGLGLSICRQLAALHFSSLRLRSRLGAGTEVSFETAIAAPRNVAEIWSRWRLAQRDPQPTLPQQDRVASTESQTSQKIRLDPAMVTVELSHQGATPRCDERFAAGIVCVGAAVSREASDAFDVLFQAQLQMYDFGYRVDTRRWIWGFDTDAHGVQDRIDSIIDATTTGISGVRLSWSKPQMIPIDSKRMHSRLSDLLIRLTLSASASSHVVDNNEVRLGTAPIVPSDVAGTRLDEELKRLSGQFQRQTKKLQRQASQLRRRPSGEEWR